MCVLVMHLFVGGASMTCVHCYPDLPGRLSSIVLVAERCDLTWPLHANMPPAPDRPFFFGPTFMRRCWLVAAAFRIIAGWTWLAYSCSSCPRGKVSHWFKDIDLVGSRLPYPLWDSLGWPVAAALFLGGEELLILLAFGCRAPFGAVWVGLWLLQQCGSILWASAAG